MDESPWRPPPPGRKQPSGGKQKGGFTEIVGGEPSSMQQQISIIQEDLDGRRPNMQRLSHYLIDGFQSQTLSGPEGVMHLQ